MEKREVIDESFIDAEEIRRTRDRFCEANHLYCSCVQRPYEEVTGFYGSEAERAFVQSLAQRELCEELSGRVLASKVENVAEAEGLPPFVRIMTVGLRVREQAAAAWVVVGFLSERLTGSEELPENIMLTSEADYYKSVQLLETLSKQYMKGKDDESALREAMKAGRLKTEEAIEKYRRSSSLSRIIGMLDSEKSYAEIIKEILKEVGDYALLSRASLIRLDRDKENVEVVSEWVKAPEFSVGVGTRRNKRALPFFTGKPYTISYGALLPLEFRSFFEDEGIKAGAYLPILVGKESAMYLAFTECEKTRNWSVDEIKFFNEAKRILQTITAKRAAKNSLTSSYAALECVLENVGCGVRVAEPSSRRILYDNSTYTSMLGDSELPRELEESFYAPDIVDSVGEYTIGERVFETHHTRITWVDGTPARLITVIDITRMRRIQKEMEYEATHDYLTGMYNRRALERDIRRILDDAVKNDAEAALFFIDIEDFKEINETLGHAYGDRLISEIGKSLLRITQAGGIAYSLGGGEFALILPPLQIDLFDDIAEGVKKAFERSWLLDDSEYFCTAAIGAVRFPREGDTPTTILQRADLALLDAKPDGKSRIEVYDDDEGGFSPARSETESALRKAVREGCSQLEVFFQPIMDVQGSGEAFDRCCGAEALVRWNSPQLGLVRPDRFIGVAEHLGLIIPIGAYVLKKACERCRFWNDMGHPDYEVSVNLSVVQLLQSDMADVIKRTVEDTGINPRNLTLEVTETLAVSDIRRMKRVLTDIASIGCRVALDGFGTGYSSLNHIRGLGIDTIKLARSLVADCGTDGFSASFVKAVAELASAIEVDVCAVGVETDRQLEAIKSRGVGLLQGYYFDKPMPAADFESKYVFTQQPL